MRTSPLPRNFGASAEPAHGKTSPFQGKNKAAKNLPVGHSHEVQPGKLWLLQWRAKCCVMSQHISPQYLSEAQLHFRGKYSRFIKEFHKFYFVTTKSDVMCFTPTILKE